MPATATTPGMKALTWPHHLALDGAPGAYEKFQKKEDGYFKVALNP